MLVSSGLPVLEDAAPFSPISNPKIVGQFLLLCGSPRVMQLGLNEPFSPGGPLDWRGSARWCGRDWAGAGVVRAGAARDSVF